MPAVLTVPSFAAWTADPWALVRSEEFRAAAPDIISATAPAGLSVDSVTHVRTAHYAAYRVEAGGREWLVRIGVSTPADSAPAENTGFLGTSTGSPTGQEREYQLARDFTAAGAPVVVPEQFAVIPGCFSDGSGLDVLWLPFMTATDTPDALSAAHWARALTPLHRSRPDTWLPVFTNRAKSMARLEKLTDRQKAAALAAEYDRNLAALFRTATVWGPVHGDAHAGNVLVVDGEPILFDFDTVCWAPAVWDITHLIVRAGGEGNTGFTADGIREAFDFTDAEVKTAVALRLTARTIARAGR